MKGLTVFYIFRYENLSEHMYPALRIRRECGCAMYDQNYDPEDYVQFVREFKNRFPLGFRSKILDEDCTVGFKLQK